MPDEKLRYCTVETYSEDQYGTDEHCDEVATHRCPDCTHAGQELSGWTCDGHWDEAVGLCIVCTENVGSVDE